MQEGFSEYTKRTFDNLTITAYSDDYECDDDGDIETKNAMALTAFTTHVLPDGCSDFTHTSGVKIAVDWRNVTHTTYTVLSGDSIVGSMTDPGASIQYADWYVCVYCKDDTVIWYNYGDVKSYIVFQFGPGLVNHTNMNFGRL